MKTFSKFAVVALAIALLAIAFTAPAVSEDAPEDVAVSAVRIDLQPPAEAAGSPPPDCEVSWRAVRLKCKEGAVGSASGRYGGSDFVVTCENPRTRICASSTFYEYEIEGIGPSGMIVRCSDSGYAFLVNASCGPFRLIIN